MLEVINFCIFEPVTLGFFPFTNFGSPGSTHNITITERSTDDVLRDVVRRLGKESTDVHRSLIRTLRGVSTCDHGGRKRTEWACPLCVDFISNFQDKESIRNSVISRFVDDVLSPGSRIPKFMRHCAEVVANLLGRRVRHFETYTASLTLHKDASF